LLAGGFLLAPMAAMISMLLAGGFLLAPMAAMISMLFAGGFVLAPIAEIELLDIVNPEIKRNIFK
tara:strand:+ start:1372 stop:1566 length:195 start_codon:yes stop_codon:yes gene_type:complete